MKSLKWEGIGTKNLFPHTSTRVLSPARVAVRARHRSAAPRRTEKLANRTVVTRPYIAAACTADSREASKAERTVEDASTAADRSGVKHHRGNSVLFTVTTFLLQAGAAEILVSCLVLLFAIARSITFRVVKLRFVSPVKIHLCLEKSETYV